MKEIPHDLHEMLLEQTRACDAVVDEKNKLINQLQLVSKTHLLVQYVKVYCLLHFYLCGVGTKAKGR